MSKHKTHSHGPGLDSVHHGHVPYWKRAHNDWRFWFGVILMFAAILFYVMTLDFSTLPRTQTPPPLSGAIEK
jgi:hypothetical protein